MSRTTRRGFLRQAGAGLLGSSTLVRGAAALAASGQRRPPGAGRCNFVFFLIDDMGWADLGCYGSAYHLSPVIDRLAAEGMRFTDAYAACPVCSPTRASILTGKYPARLHLTDFIPGHWRPWARLVVPPIRNQLPLAETTIAELLQAAGYSCGCFGKWHLGGGPQFAPDKQGFDAPAGGPRSKGDKNAAGLTDQALKFIEDHKDRPFFLYLCHHTVHIPLEAPKALVEKHTKRLKPARKPPQQANPTYAAMIEHLDNQVGRVLRKLDELNLAARSVVIFFSDNGGLIRIYTGKGEIVTSNAPLRAEKGTLYEGGVRVPLIVRFPGVVKSGSICRQVVTSVDFFPTILELAGVARPADATIDGISLAPLLTGAGGLDRDAIYWHYPHYHHCAPCGAIRAGRYKLIEHYEDGRCELYDLAEDLGEKNDLAEKLPERRAELRAKLAAWRKGVGAAMPTPNRDYDPARADQWGRRPTPQRP
jgi:arylsulfatase A-like enzyme